MSLFTNSYFRTFSTRRDVILYTMAAHRIRRAIEETRSTTKVVHPRRAKLIERQRLLQEVGSNISLHQGVEKPGMSFCFSFTFNLF